MCVCYTGEYGHGGGAKVVILSDKMAGPDRIPIPSLLAAGAVHQHLIKTKQRPKAALFVEAGKCYRDRYVVYTLMYV